MSKRRLLIQISEMDDEATSMASRYWFVTESDVDQVTAILGNPHFVSVGQGESLTEVADAASRAIVYEQT